MLSINDVAARYLADQSIRFSLFVDIETPDGDTFSLGSGTEWTLDDSGIQYDLDRVFNVHAVSPLNASLDPITRESATGSMAVVCVDDGYIRHLSNLYPLRSSIVTITLQPERYAADATVSYWAGMLVDVVPANGFVELRCKDVFDFLRTAAHLSAVELSWASGELEGFMRN
jgi:hypothetical protein